MWRGLVLFWCIRTIIKVNRAWKTLELDAYWQWLQNQRNLCPPLKDDNQIKFASFWICRLAGRIFPKQSCVLAASSAFLLINQPIKLTIGVRREGPELFAHAWAQWPQGQIQLDSQGKYDPLWEISRPSV